MTNHPLIDSWQAFVNADSIVLACHQRPDGDTLGSSLALARVLRKMGKYVEVLSEDGVPDNYSFIPESDTVLTHTERRDFDLGVLVDSESPGRVGSSADAVVSAKASACIDHHVPDGGYGQTRVVDVNSSSTAEVMMTLLDANNIEIDKTIASQLLTGLIADTGAFRFANTSPQTFHIAARLTDAGGEPSIIARNVYDTKPLRAVKLLGRALSSIKVDDTGAIVWAVISYNDMQELQATDADTDSIVNKVDTVEHAKVALLFRESEPNSVRISLRSRGEVDVNQIARVFGGGGHVAAAGCTVNASLAEAQRVVIEEVSKWTA